jgi:hypothetical protein
LIERFNLFLSALRGLPQIPSHHLVSLLVGVVLIAIGAAVAFVSGHSYRRFVKTLGPDSIPEGYPSGFGFVVNMAIAALGRWPSISA